MTKYTAASQRRARSPAAQTHAVWRGIGCLLGLLIPLISWSLAVATVRAAVDGNWPLPYQLLGNPVMPPVLWKVAGLVPVLAFVEGQRNLYAVLAITLAYVIVAGAAMSFVYAAAYRFVGPERYGPYDAPPPNFRVRRYKR